MIGSAVKDQPHLLHYVSCFHHILCAISRILYTSYHIFYTIYHLLCSISIYYLPYIICYAPYTIRCIQYAMYSVPYTLYVLECSPVENEQVHNLTHGVQCTTLNNYLNLSEGKDRTRGPYDNRKNPAKAMRMPACQNQAMEKPHNKLE